MSKLWTKQEEAVLFQAMNGKKVMYAPKAKEIAKALPGRTAEAIRRHWLLIRWNRNPASGHEALLRNKQEREKRELNEQIDMLLGESPQGVTRMTSATIGGNTYNIITPAITKTDIIRHYRDMGIRGKVTIELGD